MDKRIEKSIKDAFAVIGAVSVVKTAPVLVAGFTIGVLVSKPDKVKSAAEKIAKKLKEANENKVKEPEVVFGEEEDDDFGLDEFLEEEDRREEAEEAEITEQEIAKAFDEDVK